MTLEAQEEIGFELPDVPFMDADLEESLPSEYYTAEGIFGQERENIFFREWFCAGREEQLPDPGDYLLADVAGETIFVVRDRDGALRGHYNVCRHRGCQLLFPAEAACERAAGAPAGSTGHLARAIRCPYHSWVYGFDGKLRGAPFLRETEHLRKQDLSLHPVGVETWGGFIFVNLTPAAAPRLNEQLQRARRVYDRFRLADLRSAFRLTYRLHANWKLVMENYNECYHCAGVHPELCRIVPTFKQKGGADLDFAGGVRQREGTTTYTFSGTSNRAPLPGISPEEESLHWGGLTYPNMMTSVSSDHVAAFTLWPHGPGRTTVTCDFLFHPTEMAKPDFDPADAVEFWDLVNRQDWRICEAVQRGMSSRAYTVGYYAPMEDPSLDIRRYVLDRLGTG